MYARIRSRGHWQQWHITHSGIVTVCGIKLGDVQGEVEIVEQRSNGRLCLHCLNRKGQHDRW